MLILLLFLVIGSILLSIPAVQTGLGKKATNYLQKDFDVDIAIGKVDLALLGSVKLKNILIKDHHSDTLIKAKSLTTSIFSYRNILKNKLEFGQISLDNFILNLKTYEGEKDDALTIFVDKFDDGVKSKQPSTFLLTSSSLKLSNGYVEINDENSKNKKLLFFKNISGTASDFKVSGPNVSVIIDKLSFTENHGIEVERLSTDFSYSLTEMNFLNTELETKKSSISTDLTFSYDRKDFSDFNNKVAFSANVKEATMSLFDLKKFYNELGENDVLHFTTSISGKLNDFTTKNLDLKTDKQAIIKGDFNFKNAINLENGFSLNGEITNITSNYEHLKTVLPNLLGKNLPPYFEKFGNFNLSGNTYVTEEFIDAQITLNTAIGVAVADLKLSNINQIDKASYVGHVNITDFELGDIIGNKLVGKFSIEADVDGEGFTLNDLNTSVKGIVSKLEFKNYAYKNITLNGVLKNKLFDGELEVNDDNLKLNFNGLADLSSYIYTFDFKTTIDYCDLNTINLFKRDSISNLKGDVEIKVKGNSFDDLEGTINVNNSLYTNQKQDYFFKDFNITSSFADSIRTITINSSEIIEGNVKGNFKFNELGKLAQNSLGSIYSNYTPFRVANGQNLDFRFKIYNKIVEIFYPEVTLSANTIIRGNIKSDNNLFKLSIKSPKVEAYTNVINNLNVQIDTKNPLFNTQLSIDKIKSKYYDVSDVHLVNVTLNDTLYFRTEFKGGEENTEDFNLSFYHTFNKNNKSVFGIQKSNFTFKNNTWVLNPENNLKNKVIYDKKTNSYTINPFIIASKEQKIQFYGEINDTISKQINFNFKNVKLADITPHIDSLNLTGLINGNLSYNQFEKQLNPTANLLVSDFNINNSRQGDLKIAVEGKNSVKKYGLDISLKRDDNSTFLAVGELDFTPIKPVIDVIVDFEEFKLDAFSPLGEDVFTNIRGFVYGQVNILGELNNPKMEGELFLDKAGLYFPYINVDYDLEGTSVITLNNQTFNFEDVTLKDKHHNTTGSLTGTLSHKHFDNWALNLNLSTKNLLVLNTFEEESSLYYGTGFIDGNAIIKGPTDRLTIDVIGKTKRGTRFVIPISDVKTVETSKLIRFVNKNIVEETEEVRKAFISEKLKGLSLNFDLEVTKDAIVELVLDKSTGSSLKGSGSGNLQIALDTKDKFDMYGDFVVDNGVYNFKYGGFVNKPFTVKKGGSISWNGDPYGALIDIEAIHRVSANPKSLLENITANRKIPIDLITRFSGELFNSQRDFDIDIPNSSSTVTSELEFKLNTNDENSKTIHFISLLVSGSFYNESDLSVNRNAALYGTGFDLLSNAFDNIFNQGDNRFKLKPVYTVGEKNSVDDIDINDQLGFALDYQVNDRILINGKVGVPIGSKEQSSVIGEVNIEFLMNEEGTLRSSVFNRQNEIQYTDEEEGYTQGVGLNYQIDFDNGKELLEKLGLKKRQPKDSINNLKKTTEILKKDDKIFNFKNK